MHIYAYVCICMHTLPARTRDGLRIELEPSAEPRSGHPPELAAEAGEGEILSDAEVSAFVRANLVRALERTGWKVSGAGGAAELLDMNPNTLSSRMRSLGLRRPSRQ